MSVNVTTLLDVDMRTQMVLDKMAYEQVRLSQYDLIPAAGCLKAIFSWQISHPHYMMHQGMT